MPLQIKPHHYQILSNILSQHPYAFYAFGSRVYGTPKIFSDLDLFFTDSIPPTVLLQIEEAFEESDLPFTVDLLDYHSLDPAFQKIIAPNAIYLDFKQHPDFPEI